MSDRHPNVSHVDDLPWTESPSKNKRFAVRGKLLGRSAGSTRLGCNLFELAPGARSFPFHYHLANEEALYVLEGDGMLRLGEREVRITAGDYVAMPVGPAHAHQMINTSGAPLRYLCVSTMNEPEVTLYPDSQKIGVNGGSPSAPAGGKPLNQFVRQGESLAYYDGED